MGVRTKVSDKGVFSEKISGDDEFVIDVKKENKLKVHDPAGHPTVQSASLPVVLFQPTSSAGVTASLPEINDGNLGMTVHILTDDTSNEVLISGSGNQIDGSNTVTNTTSFGTVSLVAVSSSNSGRYWHQLSTK